MTNLLYEGEMGKYDEPLQINVYPLYDNHHSNSVISNPPSVHEVLEFKSTSNIDVSDYLQWKNPSA